MCQNEYLWSKGLNEKMSTIQFVEHITSCKLPCFVTEHFSNIMAKGGICHCLRGVFTYDEQFSFLLQFFPKASSLGIWKQEFAI